MGVIAVTGANGNVGNAALRHLMERTTSPAELVAVTRRPLVWEHSAPAPTNRIASYEDCDALTNSFGGVDTVMMISSDGEGSEMLMHHRNVIEAAEAAGVDRLVLLSNQGASRGSPFCYSVTNACTEEIAAQSGLNVVIARASLFSEFFMLFVGAALTTGELRVPAAAGTVSFVRRSDVASALAALAQADTSTGVYELTGPETIGMAQVASRAGATFSTPLEYVDIDPDRYRVELIETGTDPWWAYAYSTMFDAIRDDEFARLTNGVESLTQMTPSRFL